MPAVYHFRASGHPGIMGITASSYAEAVHAAVVRSGGPVEYVPTRPRRRTSLMDVLHGVIIVPVLWMPLAAAGLAVTATASPWQPDGVDATVQVAMIVFLGCLLFPTLAVGLCGLAIKSVERCKLTAVLRLLVALAASAGIVAIAAAAAPHIVSWGV